jgi:superfamily I DNA and/or RNA helicase
LYFLSIALNNPERQIGAAGSLQDLNVAISRAKEKLFVAGSFEMMMSRWSKKKLKLSKKEKEIFQEN